MKVWGFAYCEDPRGPTRPNAAPCAKKQIQIVITEIPESPAWFFFWNFFLARVVGCSSLSCNRLWMLKILLYMYCNVSIYGLSFTSNLFFRLYLHLQRAPLPIYFSIYLSISSTLYLSIYISLFIYLSIYPSFDLHV